MSGGGPRFYHEPPADVIDQYEQRGDGCWYHKPRGLCAPAIEDGLLETIRDIGAGAASFDSVSQEVRLGGLSGINPPEAQNPKLIRAMKDNKIPYDKLPLRVLEEDAWVHAGGAKKYGERNWRQDRILASTYEGAIMRHFIAWACGENLDPESGRSHLSHIRACCAVVLDAQMSDTLIDDRDRSESLDRMS